MQSWVIKIEKKIIPLADALRKTRRAGKKILAIESSLPEPWQFIKKSVRSLSGLEKTKCQSED